MLKFILEKLSDKITAPRFALTTVATGWIVAVVGIWFGLEINQEQVGTFLSEEATKEVTRYGFLFLIASWIHSGRVKKEIKDSFSTLNNTISNAVDALKEGLKTHSEKIDNLDSKIRVIDKRVSNLEKLDTQGVLHEGTSQS